MRGTTEFRRAIAAAVYGSAAFLGWSITPAAGGRAGVVGSDVCCLLAAAAMAVVSFRAAARATPRRRRLQLTLLGLAGTSWAVGELLWGIDELLLGRRTPFPSAADVAYLLFVPFVGLAMLLLPEAPREFRVRVRIGLDGLLVAGSLLFLTWSTLLGPAYRDGGDTPLAAVVAVAYPVADIVLVTIAISVLARLRGGPRSQPLCLAGGLVGFAVADSAFAVMSMNGTYHSGVVTDVGWVAGGLLLAVAALAPPYAGESLDEEVPRGLSTLPYVPLAVAAIVAFWSGIAHDGLPRVETVIGAAVVAIVLARHLVGVADNAQLHETLAAAIAEAERREEHFRSLVQGSSDVLTICERDGTIRFISPAVERIFGFTPDDLIGTNVLSVLHPDDVQWVVDEVEAAIAQPGHPIALECRNRHADGRWLYVEAVMTNHLDNDSVRGIVFNTRDVTERKELERQLTHQAFHDPLTGLANRSLLRDRVRLALRRRAHHPLAVLFLDLDGFKAINDSLGHAIGDRLLGSVAGRLQSVIRPGDTVARLGGDEFAVLLENLDGLHVAQQVAARIIEELHTAFTIAGHEVFIGASVGLALAAPNDDADELLRNADLAMYRAKALGKGRCEVFEPDMHAAALERMAVEGDLRHAVIRNELRLHYQPVVELASGEIVGVEALVRWDHPERGLMPPADFINVAEESGLIVPVGRWVLAEACRQVARWQRALGRPLRLSVNVSARQLQAPRLAEYVAKTLRSCGLKPNDLVLEITESMLVDDAERTIAKLHLLRELGVRLAIDDFGTGYSSLNYLRRLPVDVLKIDRSFVQGIGTETELTALTGAIVGIGRDLGLDTVAEGIEDTDQLDALREMGCALGQGYVFARPLPPAELAAVLDAGRLLAVAAG